MSAPPTGALFYDARAKPLSTAGGIQPGSYYQFYVTGTTTLTNVYADGSLTTPLSQTPGTPGGTTAAGDGRFVPIYLNPTVTYRYQLYNVGGSLLEDVDPYIPAPSQYPSLTTNGANNLVVAAPTSGTAVTINAFPGADCIDLNLDSSPGMGWGLNMTGTVNTDVRGIIITNTNTGTSAATVGLVIGTNGTATYNMGKTSNNWAGPRFTNAPPGEIGYLQTGASVPHVLAINNTAFMASDAFGRVTFFAPTGGGTPSNSTLTVNGLAGSFAAQFIAPNVSGQSFGVEIIAGTTSDNALSVVATNLTVLLNVRGDGTVTLPSIGTTASAANAFIDNAASNRILRSTSSGKYKTNIHSITEADGNIISNLRPVCYTSLAPADDPTRVFLGLIAEEVAKVDPRLVTLNEENLPDAVQYDRVTILLLKYIQTLTQLLKDKGII